ncbi:MAG: DUF2207 domain-containing protein [Pseudomonadota bacterium]
MKRLALLLFLLPALSAADERILEFHSDILVRSDGWIEVRETIRVRAEGRQIRRGIYRDFPTRYKDKRGLDQVVDYRPRSVLRNTAREDFHSVDLDNGVRTYFGNKDRFLEQGEHTYLFSYRANRMLGFFAEHDELYWNVTGFGWAFPIDKASARVSFEFDVPADRVETTAYTGRMYDQGGDYRSRVASDGSAYFDATAPLSPVNGLTVVVSWPKGFVEEPGDAERLGWVLRDNRNLLVVLAGLLALLVYYIPVWRHFGKDPEEGVLITRYEPPEAYSPASLRYVRQMYYDNKVMTSAVLSLAVKGYLRIVEEDGEHTLERLTPGSAAPPLAAGERELYDALFALSKRVQLDNVNHRTLGKAMRAHKASLKADYSRKYFKTNGLLSLPALAIVVATSVAALGMGGKPPALVLLGVALNVVVMLFFGYIMKRPTLRGRRVLDEMLGFKDYLEIAEKDELNLRNPPAKTPALFEAYLPFALAMGVDQEWSEKFAGILASIRGEGGSSYQPGWYSGSFNTSKLVSSTNTLSSGLNSAISSSVTPPGSSSGSGGGGFSGGGGGGGGGGGW